MNKVEGKYQIELNYVGDGRLFLNFWNNCGGGDVVCQIRDGKLFLQPLDENGNDLPVREVAFREFLGLVEASIIEPEKILK